MAFVDGAWLGGNITVDPNSAPADGSWDGGNVIVEDYSAPLPVRDDGPWTGGPVTVVPNSPTDTVDGPWTGGNTAVVNPHHPYLVWDASAGQLRGIAHKVWTGATLK